MKYSATEPAERPHTIQLWSTEIAALVNWHIGCTKKITRAVGSRVCELSASSVFGKPRESRLLIDEGKKLIEAHILRARGLQSILKS